VFNADKVDAFIYAPDIDTLIAVGTSSTPMGRRQQALGLDRLPVSNGGTAAHVFRTQQPFIDPRADVNGIELRGIVEGLGVRSSISAPLAIDGEPRGVLLVVSAQPDFFTTDDLTFLVAVANWLGIVGHRAELSERMSAESVARGRQAAAEEIVTVLAHDLRNFLTPIKLRVDLLRRRSTREQREDDARELGDVSSALERLGQIIASLLDVERLERGLFEGQFTVLELGEVARSMADSLRVHTTPIEIDAERPVYAQVDRDRLMQALENLMSNAVKHSPEMQPVVVSVRETFQDDRRWATVTISDRGPGIAPEVRPRLFERFAAGPGSSGLGLGLYVARRIAELHQGTLSVESNPGAGAQFTLAVPAVEAGEASDAGTRREAPQASTNGNTGA
jgi:signal transduction histidine kinase